MVNIIKLNEFKPVSRLKVPEHPITRAKFPVIDAHNHFYCIKRVNDVDALLRGMDEFNIRMIVNLDGEPGEVGETQLAKFTQARPDRFALFVQVDISRLDDAGFPHQAESRVRDFVSRGACGVKFHKWLGLGARDGSGRMLKPDDPRLRPVWDIAAELDVPVTIHIGDPPAFFDPIDATNERYEELAAFPDWSFHDPAFYRYDELMEAQCNLLRQNPHTRFIIPHVGSCAEDLARAGAMLDEFPNMYVDTAERIAEMGRQPYSARQFLIKYQDRVLYATDLVPNRANVMGNYRFYETFDEYFPYNDWDEHQQGRWNIYGVGLPDEVLRKIYYENACKVIPALKKYFHNGDV